MQLCVRVCQQFYSKNVMLETHEPLFVATFLSVPLLCTARATVNKLLCRELEIHFRRLRKRLFISTGFEPSFQKTGFDQISGIACQGRCFYDLSRDAGFINDLNS
jgi:hypothetical protein